MSEKLELVTRFEDLRPGMIVVLKGCPCGCSHRGILTAYVPEGVNAPSWRVDPQVACSAREPWLRYGALLGATKAGVDIGSVFRVIDDEVTEAKKVTSKKVRA